MRLTSAIKYRTKCFIVIEKKWKEEEGKVGERKKNVAETKTNNNRKNKEWL